MQGSTCAFFLVGGMCCLQIIKPSEQWSALRLNIGRKERKTWNFCNPFVEDMDKSSSMLGLMPCANGSLVFWMINKKIWYLAFVEFFTTWPGGRELFALWKPVAHFPCLLQLACSHVTWGAHSWVHLTSSEVSDLQKQAELCRICVCGTREAVGSSLCFPEAAVTRVFSCNI